MKVTLAQHGGLAAAVRRAPRVVDGAALPAAAAAELARLVSAAKADPAPTGPGPGRARDGMSYTVTIDDGGGGTVLTQSDADLTPAFAALLRWLEDHLHRG